MTQYFEVKRQYPGHLNIGYQRNVLKAVRNGSHFNEAERLLLNKNDGFKAAVEKSVFACYLEIRAQYFIDLSLGFSTFFVPLPQDFLGTSNACKYYAQKIEYDLQNLEEPTSVFWSIPAECNINRLLLMLVNFRGYLLEVDF